MLNASLTTSEPRTTGSPCLGCGACCRAISLEQSKSELQQLTRAERERLQRRPDHPHAGEMRRLIRDVAFIRLHFWRISRAEAIARNPALVSEDFDGRCFYRCDVLQADGRCGLHAERPYVCEGYPWYGGSPRLDALVVSPCGYEAEALALPLSQLPTHQPVARRGAG